MATDFLDKADLFKEKYNPNMDPTKMVLSELALTDEDMPALIYFLHTHPEIKTVDLSYNRIRKEGAKYFIDQNNTVESLDLTGNDFTKLGVAEIIDRKFDYLSHLKINALNDKIINLKLEEAPVIKRKYIKVDVLKKLQARLEKPISKKEQVITPLSNAVRLGVFMGCINGILDISKYTLNGLRQYLQTSGHTYFKAGNEWGVFCLGAVIDYINLYDAFKKIDETPYRRDMKLAQAAMQLSIKTQSVGTDLASLLANTGALNAASTAIAQSVGAFGFCIAAWAQAGLSIAKLTRAVKKSDMNYWVKDQIKKYEVLDKKTAELSHQLFMQRNDPPETLATLSKKLEKLKEAQKKIIYRLSAIYKVLPTDENHEKINFSVIEHFFQRKELNLEKSPPTQEEKNYVDYLRQQQKENVTGNSLNVALKITMAIGATFIAVGGLVCPPLAVAGVVMVSTVTLLEMSIFLISKITDLVLKHRYRDEVMARYMPEDLSRFSSFLSGKQKETYEELSYREKVKMEMAYQLIAPKKEAETSKRRKKLYMTLLEMSSKDRRKILDESSNKYIEKDILNKALGVNHQQQEGLGEKEQAAVIQNYLRIKKLGFFYKPLSKILENEMTPVSAAIPHFAAEEH